MSSESDQLPSVSIVVEWENIAHSAERRTEVMLGRLNHQLDETAFESRPEVIILYDPGDVDREQIDRLTGRALSNAGDSYHLDVAESEDLSYYEAKNRGAERASGEVVVFLDSDVIPEDGWLANLVGAFRDPETEVAAGHTYMDSGSLLDSVFALFWFFPTKEERPIPGFFANNVAFRRSLLSEYRFPDLPTYRGQCYELAQTLQDDGIEIVQRPGAVTSHPAPNGLGHFVIRALGQGHDQDRRFRMAARPTLLERFKRASDQLLENFSSMLARMGQRSTEVPNGRLLLAPALVVGSLYYLIAFVAQLGCSIHPSVVKTAIEL